MEYLRAIFSWVVPLLLVSNGTTSYPLELSTIGKLTPYTFLSMLYVGDRFDVGIAVHNLTNSTVSSRLILQDIDQNGFTDSIQMVNVTTHSLNTTDVNLSSLIQTAGTHSLTAIALSTDPIPSLLAQKSSTDAVVEPR